MIVRSQGKLEGVGNMVVFQNRVVVVHDGQLLTRVDQVGISTT